MRETRLNVGGRGRDEQKQWLRNFGIEGEIYSFQEVGIKRCAVTFPWISDSL